jgi:hypothetical protein
MKALERSARIWDEFVYHGFSADSLGLLRIYFGYGLLPFHALQFGALLALDPFGPAFYFTDRIWYFKLLGIHSHLPLLTPIAFVVLMVATLAMTLGRWTRTSIFVVILCIFYLKGVRDSFAGDIHHRYLMPMQMLMILLVSRCGDVRSRDARVSPPLRPLAEWEASWPIKAMQLYIASFYFWGAVAKLRTSGLAWFFGGGKIQEILVERAVRWGGTDARAQLANPLSFALAQSAWLMDILGALTLVMEAGFPLILLVRHTRVRLAFLLAVTFFHLANYLLIGVKFVFIPIVFLVFFDLVPVHAWLTTRFRHTRRRYRGRGGAVHRRSRPVG